MPTVDWSQEAVNDLLALGERQFRQAEAIRRALHQLARTGAGDLKKLEGSQDRWRLRVGDWRVMLLKRADGAYYVERVVARRDAY
ncbi:MAG: type II toxin-antitoxin system RelE family toxin [Dehalococcoidia bacterium]